MIKTKNYSSLPINPPSLDANLGGSKSLSSRILKTNLVYIIGLTKEIANKNTLCKPELFGQYGKIISVVVNYKPLKPKDSEEYYAAYITYSTPTEASLAILAVDNTYIDKNHLIRATFGNTKYCESYLKKKKCVIKDCLYVHSNNSNEVIVERNDLPKVSYRDLRLRAAKIANIFDPEFKRKLLNYPDLTNTSILPSVKTIYSKPPITTSEPTTFNTYIEEKYWQKDKENNPNFKNSSSITGSSNVSNLSNNYNNTNNSKLSVNGLKELLGPNSINIVNNTNNNTNNTNNTNNKSSKNLIETIEVRSLACNNNNNNNIDSNFNSKEDTTEIDIETLNNIEQVELTTKNRSNSDELNSSQILSITNDLVGEEESNDFNNNNIIPIIENKSNTKTKLTSLSNILLDIDNDQTQTNEEIPEIILKILKNKHKNDRSNNNDKYSPICTMLRKEILNFSASGIGATDQESKWANHILEFI